MRVTFKKKGILMKNLLVSTVAAVAVLAFAGCAPKVDCAAGAVSGAGAPVKVKPVVASGNVAPATPAPVKATPAPVVVEPVAVPVMDAKEAAVQ